MLRKGKVTAPSLAMLAALSVSMGAAGCASRTGAVASSDQPATGSEAGASTRMPVTLTGATLLAEGDAPRLLLSGAGPLSPTMYTRDEGKRIVVDLADAVASPGLEPPRADGSVLTEVSMKSFVELGKPHVQFELTTRGPVEPRLGTEPGSMAMAVTLGRNPAGPKADAVVASVAPLEREPEAIKVETLPVRTRDEQPTTSTPSSAPSEPVITARSTPQGHAASRLDSVVASSVPGGARFVLRGDGEFAYEAFSLSNPARHVVDLKGVRNAAAKKVQAVQGNLVSKVRVSQFRAAPGADAVTRVVFDLGDAAVPDLRPAKDGLVVVFKNDAPQPALVAEARPAAIPLGPSASVGPVAPDPSAQQPRSEPVPVMPAATSYERHEVEEAHEPVVRDAPAAPAPAVPAPAATVAAATVPASRPEVISAPTVQAEALPTETAATTSEPLVNVATAPVEKAPVPAAPETVAAAAPDSALPTTSAPAERVAEALPKTMTSPSAEIRVPARTVAPVRRRKAATAEDKALLEAAEALLQQQDAAGRAKDLSNPYESKAIGGGDKQFTGEPITLNLKDADIKDTLQRFSELTGLNIVLDPDVRGTVTVSLTDIPWDQALELILKINTLGYVLEGNVMRIAPTAKLATEEANKLKLIEAQDKNRPVKTVIQKLSYANVGEAARTAKNVMSARGDIFVDARSNTLIIKELPDYLPTVLDLLKNLDIPTPQVIIEARIVEATRQFQKQLGVDWRINGNADTLHGNTTGLVFPNQGTVAGQVSLPAGNQLLRLTAGNVLDTFRLDIALSAAESRGLIKIISTPKVQTQTNLQASIQSGFQIPVQTTVNNTTSVLYIDATLRLEVTPQITSEGTVIMDVKVQKREPALALNIAGGSNVPLTTRDAKTTLMVRDGATAIIGGIFKLTTNDSRNMVPGLWKIPILGNLFRNKTESEASDELMIFITPRIIKN